MGFKVSGKLAPETVNPAPVTFALLIVTAEEPVEDRVTVCVEAAFTFTLPKTKLLVLMPSVGTVPPSCTENVFAALPALAVRVTVVAVLTVEAEAVKIALVVPAATVTLAGTAKATLLLARLTTNPPAAAAAFSVTVQLSVPVPEIDPLAQLSPLSTGTPLPLRLIVVDVPEEELLVSVSVPAAAPLVAGSNCTVSVAV